MSTVNNARNHKIQRKKQRIRNRKISQSTASSDSSVSLSDISSISSLSLCSTDMSNKMSSMGTAELQELLTQTPENVAVTILEECGFKKLLMQKSIQDDVLVLVIKVVTTATRSHEAYDVLRFLQEVLQSEFFSRHLIILLNKLGTSKELNESILGDIGNICYFVAQQMPKMAVEKLQLCVDMCQQCFTTRQQLMLPVSSMTKELVDRASSLLSRLETEDCDLICEPSASVCDECVAIEVDTNEDYSDSSDTTHTTHTSTIAITDLGSVGGSSAFSLDEVEKKLERLEHTMLVMRSNQSQIIDRLMPLFKIASIDLSEHPVFRTFPPVKGTKKSVHFIDHSFSNIVESETNSWCNMHEAGYLVAFCKYFLQQGYASDRIVLISGFEGQFNLLNTLLKQKKLEGVEVLLINHVNVVKQKLYDIALISFVSCSDADMRFLDLKSNVNSILSEIHCGIFCIGKFQEIARNCARWQNFFSLLESRNMVSNGIDLICQKHTSTTNTVVDSRDFEIVTPEGGCRQVCGEILPCGHTCEEMCHMASHSAHCQSCTKKQSYENACSLPCYAKCKPCRIETIKSMLGCSHQIPMPCYKPVENEICKVEIKRVLPQCHHEALMFCHINPLEYNCCVQVEKKFPNCQHVEIVPCHATQKKSFCTLPCGQLLNCCGSICFKRCHNLTQKCEKYCNSVVTKRLSCGHTGEVLCPKEPDTFTCKKKCCRTLPCGHVCSKLCHEKCGGCKETVVKALKCSHHVRVECTADLKDTICVETCGKKLPCSHFCQEKCGKPCTKQCTFEIKLKGSCGHELKRPCFERNLPELISRYCKQPCNKVISDCQHPCKGTCGECRQGRVHVSCQYPSWYKLPCLHFCNTFCKQWRPPCDEPCPVICAHSACKRKCGEPCIPCVEPCAWQCQHQTCTRLCSEVCDRLRCNEPCPKKLSCGHSCIGFCGETCPPLCRICNCINEDLSPLNIDGKKIGKNARFVYLSDCEHVIGVETMDNWMNQKSNVKCCPCCGTVIWKNFRYGNIIKSQFRRMETMKEATFGSNRERTVVRESLLFFLSVLKNQCISRTSCDFYVTNLITDYVEKLTSILKKTYLLSRHEAALFRNQINLLQYVSEIVKESTASKCSEKAETFVKTDCKLLLDRLFINRDHMTEFEFCQIATEIERTHLQFKVLEFERLCDKDLFYESTLKQAKDLLASGEVLKQMQEPDKEECINRIYRATQQHFRFPAYSSEICLTTPMFVNITDVNMDVWLKCPNCQIQYDWKVQISSWKQQQQHNYCTNCKRNNFGKLPKWCRIYKPS